MKKSMLLALVLCIASSVFVFAEKADTAGLSISVYAGYIKYDAEPMVRRITPPRDADLPGNTFNGIAVPYYTHTVCQAGDDIFCGGIFPYLIRIKKSTGKAVQFLGDLYSVNRLVPGNSVKCRQPARVGTIKYDSGSNKLFIAYHSGENCIAYYDFTRDYYDRLSGEAYETGSVRGNSSTARYFNPAWIDVKGNTVYVSDSGNHLLVGVDIKTKISYIIMGQDQASDALVTGAGLTTRCKLPLPRGICLESTGNTVFVIAMGRYLVGIQPQYDRSWLIRDFGTDNMTGMDISNDDKYLYIVLAPKIIKYDIARNTFMDYTAGGIGDNYTYFDSVVTTANCRFSPQIDNVSVGEDGNIYVGDYLNKKFKMIDVKTSRVTTIAGYGNWSAGTRSQHTGWGSPAGFDYYGNTLLVSDGTAYMIKKVYEDGTTEDVAGKPGLYGHVDGVFGTSLLGALRDGKCAVTGGVPYYYFMDNGTFRRLDLRTNMVTTIAGTSDSYGYKEGSGSAVKYGSSPFNCIDITGNKLYFTDCVNSVVRKLDLRNMTSSLVAGKDGLSGWVMGRGLTTEVRFKSPSGIKVDPKAADHIYINDAANGVACLDLGADSAKAMEINTGTGSLAIKYEDNGDRILIAWSGSPFPGGFNLYNDRTRETTLLFRARGTGDEMYSVDRDGNSYEARAVLQNARIKYFQDKKRFMFDSSGRFQSLRYYDENLQPLGAAKKQKYEKNDAVTYFIDYASTVSVPDAEVWSTIPAGITYFGCDNGGVKKGNLVSWRALKYAGTVKLWGIINEASQCIVNTVMFKADGYGIAEGKDEINCVKK